MVRRTTQVIVIEGATDAAAIEALLTNENITVNAKSVAPFTMKRPELIITSQTLTEADFTERRCLDFITCSFKDATRRQMVMAAVKRLKL